MKKIEIKTLYRSAVIVSGSIDKEKLTVDLSFSSEEPVERWFGTEILDHKKTSVDMSRLNNSAAVLLDHRGGQIGVVEKAQIKDKIGLARLRFSKQGVGKKVFDDIEDGIMKNVSFGYRVNKFEDPISDDDGNKTYRSKDWTPHEISMVGVPADHSIGVGRSSETTFSCEVPDSFRAEGDETEQVIDDAETRSKEKSDRYTQQKRRKRKMLLGYK